MTEGSGQIHTFDGKAPFETPRPLAAEEISAVIDQYRWAAELSAKTSSDCARAAVALTNVSELCEGLTFLCQKRNEYGSAETLRKWKT